jgi:hypothetical protein
MQEPLNDRESASKRSINSVYFLKEQFTNQGELDGFDQKKASRRNTGRIVFDPEN